MGRYEVINTDNLTPSSKQYEVVDTSAPGYDINNPIDSSPLSATDRLKLSFGNENGNIDYLKSNYEDAAYDSFGNLNIKKNGSWYRTDASGLEVNDLVDLAPDAMKAVSAVLGAGIGGLAAAPSGPGALLAASAGSAVGNLAAEGVRERIGEYMGTYKTGQTEVRDQTWALLEGLAGPAVGQILAGGTKFVGKTLLSRAPEASKEIIAKTLNLMNGAKDTSNQALVEMPEKVLSTMRTNLVKEGSESGAIQASTSNAIKLTKTIIDEAEKELPRQYGKLVKEVSNLTPKNFSLSFNKIAGEVEDELIQNGWAFRMTESGPLKAMTEARAMRLKAVGGEGIPLTKEVERQIDGFLKTLHNTKLLGSQSGPRATKLALDLKAELNNLRRSMNVSSSGDPNLERAVTQTIQGLTSRIADKYDKAGMLDQFLKPSNLYKKYSDGITLSKTIINSKNAETLLNQLASRPGKNQTSKEGLQSLVELLGEKGQRLHNEIRVNLAAADLTPKLPVDMTRRMLGIAGIFSGKISAGFGLPLAIAASPRYSAVMAGKALTVADKIAPYSSKIVDFVRSQTPETMSKVLQRPELLQTIFQTTIDAAGNQHTVEQQLMNEVNNNGQQQQ